MNYSNFNNNLIEDTNIELILTVLSTVLGILNYQENKKQTSNDDLLEELKHQDNDYLSKLIKQNEITIAQNSKIIRLLEGGKNA